MTVLELISGIYFIILEFTATNIFIFRISIILDHKQKGVIVKNKKVIKWLLPFAYFRVENSCEGSKVVINKMVYVLTIIAYILYLPSIAIVFLLYFLYGISNIWNIIRIFCVIFICLHFLFVIVLVVIHEVERKRKQKQEKKDEMNFKI